MPHSKIENLPTTQDRWPTAGQSFRSVQWGDMEVGFTRIPHALDCTSLYKDGGLPGGVCQCPHYGYLFEGTLRCTYPGADMPDEVARAGEAYFFPAGHVLIYEDKTVALEFNPAHALQELMAGMERAISKMDVKP